MLLLSNTSIFALIIGIAIHPRKTPIHQTGTVLPKARKKFSVLIERSSVLQIILTRLFGAGNNDDMMLPTINVRPVTVFITPSATSPLPLLDNSIAGNAALYIDADKFIAAKKRMRFNIPRFSFKYLSPVFTECKTLSFSSCEYFISGIFTKNKSTIKAIAKLIRSKIITACIPNRARKIVAITGVMVFTREFENDLSPLTF